MILASGLAPPVPRGSELIRHRRDVFRGRSGRGHCRALHGRPSVPLGLTSSVKEPIPLQLVAGSAGHAVCWPGSCSTAQASSSPTGPSRSAASLPPSSVALGKRFAPPHAVSPRGLSPGPQSGEVEPPVGIEPTTFSLRVGPTPSHPLSTSVFVHAAAPTAREIPHRYPGFVPRVMPRMPNTPTRSHWGRRSGPACSQRVVPRRCASICSPASGLWPRPATCPARKVGGTVWRYPRATSCVATPARKGGAVRSEVGRRGRLLVLSLVSLAALAGSGYLGGKLAYRYGVRVADESTQSEGYRVAKDTDEEQT